MMRYIRNMSLIVVFTCFSRVSFAQEEFNLSVLDLTFVQDNDSLTINELPSEWPLTYGITPKPGPLSIIVPLDGCDPESEATYVRAYQIGSAEALVETLVMVRDTSRVDDPMEIVFTPGNGFATDMAVQAMLFADAPGDGTVEQGFNVFFGPRYASVDDGFATITIDRIEGEGGWDPLTAGEPFVLMIGRGGCTAPMTMPISLIAVTY
ncbi:MAG: hypothetical protein ACRCS3_06070 [Paracoccaceae bacterium]